MPQPPFLEDQGARSAPDKRAGGPNRLPLFGSAKLRIAQVFVKINRFAPFFE